MVSDAAVILLVEVPDPNQAARDVHAVNADHAASRPAERPAPSGSAGNADALSVRELAVAANNHLLAGRDSGDDLDVGAEWPADRHRPALEAVALEDEHDRAVAVAAHGRGRHDARRRRRALGSRQPPPGTPP